MAIKYGKLFLIPNFLSDENEDDFISGQVRRMVHQIKHFVVENEKQARALIKRLQLESAQSELKLWVLNEHTLPQQVPELLEALENSDAGIISDAGLPCIADPGSILVSLAQNKGIEVIPLPGASSIFMTLMASGFNGQQFTFNGYLPIEKPLRVRKLKELEQLAAQGVTQIFMETPYRNNQLVSDLLGNLKPNTSLSIGCKVGGNSGWVKTKTVNAWKSNIPDLHKLPCIFVIGN
jgi:16S rRNA (cytidine1402-2'-O)-methyltransferase